MPFEDPDDGPSGPPPDPLDRLWVHPSELASGPRRPSRARRAGRDWILVLAAGAFGALVTTAVLGLAGAFGSEGSSSDGAARATPVAALAARAAPSIVGVVAVTTAGERRSSGVAVEGGWVLTSCTALQGAGAVTVATTDGRARPATVQGRDVETDLALLRVEGLRGGITTSAPGRVRVGDAVVALGSGRGTRSWVASGVVSSVAAVVVEGNYARAGLIATDALVGDDAPGGALLDGSGELVGVLTSGSKGGGIAVPIAVARDVAAQLRERGKAGHGWLGVGGVDALDHSDGGVRVESVAANSPAERAGIETGDVITRMNGTTLSRMIEMMAAVRRRHPGDRLVLRLTREGHTRDVTVKVGDVPESAPAGSAPPAATATTTTSTPVSPDTVPAVASG